MAIDNRGFLLHFTHYDPHWYANKAKEKPFDIQLGRRIVDCLAEEGFTCLMIDIEDGVVFDGHPELVRHYSRPMSELEEIAGFARDKGLDVIPKLNMSRSAINCHNHWMRAEGETWYDHFDDDYWFDLAFALIDQSVAACKPQRFVHIGMDEDHDRSYSQHSSVIRRFHKGLGERQLRPIMWNDSGIDYESGHIYVEKAKYAEEHIPKDIPQILWHYRLVPEEAIRRIRRKGLELWAAPGSNDPDQCRGFLDMLEECGGSGVMMTRWVPCIAANEEAMLKQIRDYAPLYRRE